MHDSTDLYIVVNFIQRPLPIGSSTGAGKIVQKSGALGMGQRASTGLVMCKFMQMTPWSGQANFTQSTVSGPMLHHWLERK